MKRHLVLVTVLTLVLAMKSRGQGFFNFANGASGVNAPISDFNGFSNPATPLSGTAYKADYYWGPAGIIDPTVLISGGQAISFAANGYFFGGTQIINGQTGTVTLQIRVWRASDGATYAAAAGTGGAHAGGGNLIQVALGTGAGTVPNMVGLQSFTIAVAGPEPATFLIFLIGCGALLMRRPPRRGAAALR
ncbi:MAG: hypothetical protein JWO95_1994 [Verrucomicrobiales bacterium]|nr:hypothetical protein [Verrucomicrobiales bacterium]